ncbi:MAG TPA: PilZ domain-containing protein [Thermodesulfovibrionales bacterium]|nr:PilZ domain-containing protein [Thermodesulfovibrionales bacterium]
MVAKRQNPRYLIKLPAEISTGDYLIRGTTVRVSMKGFFFRSQASFRVGTPVDINLHLTGELSCVLKGIVRYARNIIEFKRQNGMGIEFTEIDSKYLEFIRSVEQEK